MAIRKAVAVALSSLALASASLATSASAAPTATGAVDASAALRNEGPGAPVTAAGIPGPFKIVNQYSGLCLDYGTEGNYAYLGVCNSTDAGQRWGWYNGGFLINLSNNKCASANYDPQFPVAVVACSDYGGQHWTHQNFAIVNENYGFRCMEAQINRPGSVILTRPCRTSSHQGWYVYYW
ncbi:RICIN domain-containing protein [Streptomyces sp. NPDC001868]|uniref:RICIN domain-containing protein n=1 Tax=Streptomyces sp. NPDC001868 TaxID=3154401 RepID=UPI00332D2FCD